MVRKGKPADADPAERLVDLASKAMPRPVLKKVKVMTRVAEMQAAAGDAEDAEVDRRAQRGHPKQAFSSLQARVKILGDIARAQLATKRVDAAREAIRVAAGDDRAPFQGITPSRRSPSAASPESLARAGEHRGGRDGRLRLVPDARVDALAVAVVQANSGDPAGAEATFDKATRAAADIINPLGLVVHEPRPRRREHDPPDAFLGRGPSRTAALEDRRREGDGGRRPARAWNRPRRSSR